MRFQRLVVPTEMAAGARPASSWRARLACAAGIAVSILLPAPVTAQGGEGFVTFQFSFANPGARSLGFGGAFVALADDATAAFVNPAGLVQLIEPEVSLEGRFTSFSTPYTRGGRLDGEPTGIGVDTTLGFRTARSSEDLFGASFIAWVYPLEDWSFAVYRHQLANFAFSSETDILLNETRPPYPPGFTSRQLDVRAMTDSETIAWGLSAARQITSDLSVGLSLVLVDGRLSSFVEGFYPDSQERFFEPNSYLPKNQVAVISYDLDDQDWAATGGFLWKISELWRLGGFYRQGPVLEMLGETRSGRLGLLGPPGALLESLDLPIHYPDVYGLGTAFRSGDGRVTLSFEWDRVEYSTIIDRLGIDAGVVLDDGDELRIGAEYVFLGSTPLVAARVGAWLDPDHRTRARVPPETAAEALFLPGDDELHVALGLGVVLPSLQLDLAVDLSDLVDTVSLSTIFSF